MTGLEVDVEYTRRQFTRLVHVKPPIVAERDRLLPHYEAWDRLWRTPINWVQVALLIGPDRGDELRIGRDRIGCADYPFWGDRFRVARREIHGV